MNDIKRSVRHRPERKRASPEEYRVVPRQPGPPIDRDQIALTEKHIEKVREHANRLHEISKDSYTEIGHELQSAILVFEFEYSKASEYMQKFLYGIDNRSNFNTIETAAKVFGMFQKPLKMLALGLAPQKKFDGRIEYTPPANGEFPEEVREKIADMYADLYVGDKSIAATIKQAQGVLKIAGFEPVELPQGPQR